MNDKPMRNIARIGIEGYKLYHVVSEPGDMTRYEFIIYQEFDCRFRFMEIGNIKFPSELNIFNQKHTMADYKRIAGLAKCNPWTIKECFEVAKIIRGME